MPPKNKVTPAEKPVEPDPADSDEVEHYDPDLAALPALPRSPEAGAVEDFLHEEIPPNPLERGSSRRSVSNPPADPDD